jgi:hypothetical protein
VGAHLELLAALLVNVRRTVDGELLDAGPRTWAPVRFAVFTISRVDVSRIRWSNALSRMRIFWPFIAVIFL